MTCVVPFGKLRVTKDKEVSDISDLVDGVYVVQITDAGAGVVNRRLVVAR